MSGDRQAPNQRQQGIRFIVFQQPQRPRQNLRAGVSFEAVVRYRQTWYCRDDYVSKYIFRRKPRANLPSRNF